MIDLTKGKERKALILFSLPMIAGNLLQQLYNIVDTLIVGRYLGPNALGAVGSSYALMVLLTSIILGLCMGSGVVFSWLYGAGKMDELKTSIVNSFGLIFIITVLVNVVSVLLLDKILVWLRIPPEALNDTKKYLSVIFVGIIFTFIYNFFAAVLRSIGNSLIPLIFLGISALLNIILDIYFIVDLHMGVEGAAIATVIAQGVSAIAISLYFFVKAENLRPSRRNFKFDKALIKRIFSNSILTSIQQSIMNFGILMIQGLVNSFGVAAMAAFAAVVKIDAFAYMPVQDFGNAFATYIAQNYGAKNEKRIKKGCKEAFLISSIFCVIVSIIVFVFAKDLMVIFIKPQETEIIKIGIEYLRIEGTFYIGIGILFLLYGFHRGLSNPWMSIVLTLISLGSRVGLAYFLSSIPMLGMKGIWWSIPIGWILADIVGLFALKSSIKKKQTSLSN